MSLLDDFKENTGIFKGQENRIDQEAFDKLTEEHGIEFARGFLKCMQEVEDILGKIVFKSEIMNGSRETPTNAYNKIYYLHEKLFYFCKTNGLNPDEDQRPHPIHKTRKLGW